MSDAPVNGTGEMHAALKTALAELLPDMLRDHASAPVASSTRASAPPSWLAASASHCRPRPPLTRRHPLPGVLIASTGAR